MGEKGEKQKRMREDDMSVHAEALLEQQQKHLKIKNQKTKGKTYGAQSARCFGSSATTKI